MRSDYPFTAEEWGCITKKERFYNEPYLFCYFLGNNPEQREFVRRVKEITGCKIVQLQHCDEYIKSDVEFPDYAPYNVGPAEFVQLIRDAEYVFTDSFHASVFSLLYQKKFLLSAGITMTVWYRQTGGCIHFLHW